MCRCSCRCCFVVVDVLVLLVNCYCVGVCCVVVVEYVGVGWCVVVAHLSLSSLFVGLLLFCGCVNVVVVLLYVVVVL